MGIWIDYKGRCLLCDCVSIFTDDGELEPECSHRFGVGFYQDRANQEGDYIPVRGMTEEKANMLYQDVIAAIARGDRLYTVRED